MLLSSGFSCSIYLTEAEAFMTIRPEQNIPHLPQLRANYSPRAACGLLRCSIRPTGLGRNYIKLSYIKKKKAELFIHLPG